MFGYYACCPIDAQAGVQRINGLVDHLDSLEQQKRRLTVHERSSSTSASSQQSGRRSPVERSSPFQASSFQFQPPLTQPDMQVSSVSHAARHGQHASVQQGAEAAAIALLESMGPFACAAAQVNNPNTL